MMQAGAPQVVTVQPGLMTVTAPNQQRPGNWKGMTVTGIIQIVAGSLTVILGIADLVNLSLIIAVIGYNIWSGLLFYVVAGILGVVAGTKKIRGVAIGYMVMSILACLASCVVIGFSSTALSILSGCYLCSGYTTVHAFLLILGLVEFVASITGASMTCSAVCYTEPTQTVIAYQAQPQMVVAGQPQLAYAPPAQYQPAQYQPHLQAQAMSQAQPTGDYKY